MERGGEIRSPDTEKNNRIPPGQTATDQFPVFHYGDIPEIDASRWKLRIFGLVRHKKHISYQEFVSLPKVRVLADIHCVTGWSSLENIWEGVAARTIRELADILPEARFVMVHSAGGFTTNLSLDDFFADDVLFAVKHNGEPLSPEHGYPVRLVVPRLYFWKSAKWVEGIEFIQEERLGFWESQGYHHRGDPWKEERYSAGEAR